MKNLLKRLHSLFKGVVAKLAYMLRPVRRVAAFILSPLDKGLTWLEERVPVIFKWWRTVATIMFASVIFLFAGLVVAGIVAGEIPVMLGMMWIMASPFVLVIELVTNLELLLLLLAEATMFSTILGCIDWLTDRAIESAKWRNFAPASGSVTPVRDEHGNVYARETGEDLSDSYPSSQG